ncbi:MAG TPA: alpha/beta hydrolase [Pseudomonadales bacterium]|nr:alpha/beta hydrolase [Pseudomonadales bacterium]
MPAISVFESRVHTPAGQLFVKRWRPHNNAETTIAPIILLHDSLGSVALWRDFPEQLAQATGREVIAYDRLGFGASDPYPGAIATSFIRDEARHGFAAVCEQLALEKFILFGHSVGGAMASICAATYPDRCLALITESAQAFVEECTREGIRTAKAMFDQPGQIDRLKKYHGEKAQWVLNSWVNTWLSSGFDDWNIDADLAHVRCPLLSIHGEEDEYGSEQQPRRYTSMVSGVSTLCLLPACGHVPHREMAETVLSSVADFLQQHLH